MKDNKIINLFITDLLFLLMISPFILYCLIFQNNISTAIMLILSILIGPSITALFSTMGKLIREGDISPVKDFFYFYRMSLVQSLIVSIILNLAISIISFDMNYFSVNGNKIMSYLFFAVLVLILIINLYIYPLISRYSLKLFDIFKISAGLLIKKPYITLISASIILIIFGLLKLNSLSLIGIMLIVSAIAYALMKVQRETIDGLGDYIKNLYQ